jgi:hypothetical protein
MRVVRPRANDCPVLVRSRLVEEAEVGCLGPDVDLRTFFGGTMAIASLGGIEMWCGRLSFSLFILLRN